MHIKKFYKYKNWYRKTRAMLMRKYGKDYKLFSGLLASTSPRFQVKRNYNISLLIFNDYNKNKIAFLKYAIDNQKKFIKKYKLLPAHYNNIIRTLSHDFTKSRQLVLSGQKVNSFYNNLIGNYQAVTLDVWMLKYFNHTKKTFNLSDYRYYTRIIKRYAKKLDMLPAECQAVLWNKQRHIEGVQPSNFYKHISIA